MILDPVETVLRWFFTIPVIYSIFHVVVWEFRFGRKWTALDTGVIPDMRKYGMEKMP